MTQKFERIVGNLKPEGVRELAVVCLNAMSDADAITTIIDYVYGDDILVNELSEQLEQQK